MSAPHVTLSTSMSLDGRTDPEYPALLYNRLDDYRLQKMRGQADAILTNSETIRQVDPVFSSRESVTIPATVIVDKTVETPSTARIFEKPGRIILATPKNASKYKVKKLQDVSKNLTHLEFGEYAVNMEDLLWELHGMGIKKIILEADTQLNMRMLNQGMVNEIYLMVAPVILGMQKSNVFESKLDENIDLDLEGILQYGDHIVLHYKVDKKAV